MAYRLFILTTKLILDLFEAMDQPGHVTRFLLYQHFCLYNLISIKIKTVN